MCVCVEFVIILSTLYSMFAIQLQQIGNTEVDSSWRQANGRKRVSHNKYRNDPSLQVASFQLLFHNCISLTLHRKMEQPFHC